MYIIQFMDQRDPNRTSGNQGLELKMSKFATFRKSEQSAMGWIVEILGIDYAQTRTRDEARSMAAAINSRCVGMTEDQVRNTYHIS